MLQGFFPQHFFCCGSLARAEGSSIPYAGKFEIKTVWYAKFAEAGALTDLSNKKSLRRIPQGHDTD